MRQSIAAVGLAISIFTARVGAEEPAVEPQLRGAAVAIRDAKGGPGAPENIPPRAIRIGELVRRIDAYAAKSSALPPIDAAKQWLALLGEARTACAQEEDVQNENVVSYANSLIDEVFVVFPGPSTWKALSQEIDARPTVATGIDGIRVHSLRMFGHVLTKDEPAQLADAESLLALLRAERKAPVKSAKDVHTTEFGSDFDAAWPLVWSVWKRKSPEEIEALWREQFESDSEYSRTMPDLVSLVGEERARPILNDVITVAARAENDRRLWGAQGTNDGKVLAEIGTKRIDEFAAPPWILHRMSKNPAEVRAAIFRTFPNDQSSDRFDAMAQETERLVEENKPWEAVAMYKTVLTHDKLVQRLGTRDTFGSIERNEQTWNSATRSAAKKFFAEIVQASPTVENWRGYLAASRMTGDAKEAISALEKFLAQSTPDSEWERERLTDLLKTAYLNADRIDDAIELLKRDTRGDGPDTRRSNDAIESLGELARLGQLLDRDELKQTSLQPIALTLQSRVRQSAAGGPFSSKRPYLLDETVELLIEAGSIAEVESYLHERLREATSNSTQRSLADRYADNYDCIFALSELMRFYVRQKRYGDAVVLLEEAPWWGHDDLSDVINERAGFEPASAARALKETGRLDAVRRVLDSIFATPDPDSDAFQLLIEIDAIEAIRKLDEMIAENPREVLPTLWKAKALLRAKRLDEAEHAARAAVALASALRPDARNACCCGDSDGQDTDAGTDAFEFLSELLAGKDDDQSNAERELYLRRAEAGRLVERARMLSAAGLIPRAIDVLQDALGLCNDSSHLHSSLARETMKVGRIDEAMKHVRRACECLASRDQKGRLAFPVGAPDLRNSRAAQIADEVFSEALKKSPDDPVLLRLLGKVRDQQGRSDESLALYRRAATLEPGWEKTPDAEITAIDPSIEVYPLAASARAIEEERRKARAMPYDDYYAGDLDELLWRLGIEPRKTTLKSYSELANQPVVRSLKAILPERS